MGGAFTTLRLPAADRADTCDAGVNVIDVENSKVLENMTVKIKDGTIASISKASSADMQEEGFMSVDAGGLFMCPGLIDCEQAGDAFISLTDLYDQVTHISQLLLGKR